MDSFNTIIDYKIPFALFYEEISKKRPLETFCISDSMFK
jgi:hypothetical protein